MREYSFKKKQDFLSKYIDVFSVLLMDKKNWLTEKEKEYMILSILVVNEGLALTDPKSTKRMVELGNNIQESDIYVYRGKLRKKKWLEMNHEILIPPAFVFKNWEYPISKNLNFNFSLKLNEEG